MATGPLTSPSIFSRKGCNLIFKPVETGGWWMEARCPLQGFIDPALPPGCEPAKSGLGDAGEFIGEERHELVFQTSEALLESSCFAHVIAISGGAGLPAGAQARIGAPAQRRGVLPASYVGLGGPTLLGPLRRLDQRLGRCDHLGCELLQVRLRDAGQYYRRATNLRIESVLRFLTSYFGLLTSDFRLLHS
jgi:hypothetical protein